MTVVLVVKGLFVVATVLKGAYASIKFTGNNWIISFRIIYQKYQLKPTNTPETIENITTIAVIHSYFIQLNASVSIMYSGLETYVPIVFYFKYI